MSIIKFNRKMPWFDRELSQFFDVNDFFKDDFWTMPVKNQPALNIKETDNAFEIELAAPGLEKKDFKISIDDGYLNISAEKTVTDEEENETYARKEFSYNSFRRSLMLPDTVLQEDVKAMYKDGILKLNLAKKEATKINTSKSIEIS